VGFYFPPVEEERDIETIKAIENQDRLLAKVFNLVGSPHCGKTYRVVLFYIG
jgi:hypothetical protein